MTRRLAAKHKIDRRYGTNLWGRPKSSVNVRAYKPGQHGQKSVAKTGRVSAYGEQLTAKQMLKGYYDMDERQFRRFYALADRRRGNTGQNLVGLLERRLTSVVYRMKLAPTIFAARQLISHGHVRVDGKRVDIPSFLVRENQVISVKEASCDAAFILSSLELAEREVPEYTSFDKKKMQGEFLRVPLLEDIPFPFQVNMRSVIEWYARRI